MRRTHLAPSIEAVRSEPLSGPWLNLNSLRSLALLNHFDRTRSRANVERFRKRERGNARISLSQHDGEGVKKRRSISLSMIDLMPAGFHGRFRAKSFVQLIIIIFKTRPA
jgi:hypothetical protein